MVKPLCVIGWEAFVLAQKAGPLRNECFNNKEVDYLAKQALNVSIDSKRMYHI